MGDSWEERRQAREFFICCPLCGADREKMQFDTYKPYAICENCGGKWAFYPTSGIAWLIQPADDRTGANLVNKMLKKEDWQRMGREIGKRLPPPPPPPDTVTIREKETIIKEVVLIPCQYCGGLIPQTSIFCPNCGAKRKA